MVDLSKLSGDASRPDAAVDSSEDDGLDHSTEYRLGWEDTRNICFDYHYGVKGWGEYDKGTCLDTFIAMSDALKRTHDIRHKGCITVPTRDFVDWLFRQGVKSAYDNTFPPAHYVRLWSAGCRQGWLEDPADVIIDCGYPHQRVALMTKAFKDAL